MVEVLALPHRVASLGRAVEQFLAAKPLSANGCRSYAHTLGMVVGDLGADLALDGFTAERVRHVLEDRWETLRLRRGTTVSPRWGRSAAGHRHKVGSETIRWRG